jgi:hypothetical protein
VTGVDGTVCASEGATAAAVMASPAPAIISLFMASS